VTGFGGPAEHGGDLGDGVEFARGDRHDELVGGIVGQDQPSAVDAVEGNQPGQGEPLVAVDEGMVAGQGVQQGPPGLSVCR
jgi:hypothetical protein